MEFTWKSYSDSRWEEESVRPCSPSLSSGQATLSQFESLGWGWGLRDTGPVQAAQAGRLAGGWQWLLDTEA